ncbi:MAG TPA: hypothetical protein VGB98_04035 [Pyrinomonadaceae bacterium]|jgi:hypothetical protein
MQSPIGRKDPARERPARAALIIAHPGHELRVHGWLEEALPLVCVLTDGSGRTQRSRLDSTTKVLEAAGTAHGPVYGAMSDVELYTAVLDHDLSPFTRVVDELADMLLREQIDRVAGDAEEGYNPAHDVSRLVINAAVRLVNLTSRRQIANYDFTLVAPPGHCPEALRADSIRLELDEAAFARKLSAARNYPELQAEVEAALSGAGSVGLREHPDLARRAGSDFGGAGAPDFGVEWLRRVDDRGERPAPFNGEIPFYEEYGERQVAAGHYERVLRYREHVLPLAAALNAHVERNS